MAEMRRFFVTAIRDFIGILFIGLPVLFLFIFGDPFKRGFYCDDESIRYPFKESTVSNVQLYVVNIGLLLIGIVGTECLLFTNGLGSLSAYLNRRLFFNIYNQIIPCIFGALTSQCLTDIAKYSIGRLRPHFIDVCRPRFYFDSCPKTVEYKYITDFECTTSDQTRIRDSRLSFMSGHSSFSAYCMVYLVPLVQILLIYSSIWTGFTRISDYKHHWSDVLCGLLQGTLVALLSARFLASFTRKNQRKYETDVAATIGTEM